LTPINVLTIFVCPELRQRKRILNLGKVTTMMTKIKIFAFALLAALAVAPAAAETSGLRVRF
jgi:hypothetical protein